MLMVAQLVESEGKEAKNGLKRLEPEGGDLVGASGLAKAKTKMPV